MRFVGDHFRSGLHYGVKFLVRYAITTVSCNLEERGSEELGTNITDTRVITARSVANVLQASDRSPFLKGRSPLTIVGPE